MLTQRSAAGTGRDHGGASEWVDFQAKQKSGWKVRSSAVVNAVWEICGSRLCTVVHCYAKVATDVSESVNKNNMLQSKKRATNQAVGGSTPSGCANSPVSTATYS